MRYVIKHALLFGIVVALYMFLGKIYFGFLMAIIFAFMLFYFCFMKSL
jgi:hypothetical protein